MLIRQVLVATLAVAAAACRPPPASSVVLPDAGVAARWSTGFVTADEVRAEAQKLPPALRDQFLTPNGQREFVQTVVARRLLLEEAHRRNLQQTADIARQVRELEDRLALQALLAAADKEAGEPAEADLKGYYDAHTVDFAVPARVHAGRLLFRGAAADQKLRARAEAARQRLLKGEPLAKVASLGEGPERFNGGDVGWVSKPDNAEMQAALALKAAGAVAPLLETDQGLSVICAIAREEGRTPPFEEVRGAVAGRYAPVQQRKVFDQLVERLKANAQVQFASKP